MKNIQFALWLISEQNVESNQSEFKQKLIILFPPVLCYWKHLRRR